MKLPRSLWRFALVGLAATVAQVAVAWFTLSATGLGAA